MSIVCSQLLTQVNRHFSQLNLHGFVNPKPNHYLIITCTTRTVGVLSSLSANCSLKLDKSLRLTVMLYSPRMYCLFN